MYPVSPKLPFHPDCHIQQSCLCYTVGPCWLSILNIAVCTCPSQTLYPFPLSFPSTIVSLLSQSLRLFLLQQSSWIDLPVSVT